VLGLSDNELWWNVANPRNLEQTCWLYTLSTTVSGDISQLPLVAGPPPGAVPPAGPGVELMGITVDAENRYAVDFAVEGFEPAYPGTHIHFFFNTFSPADVGIGGEANRRAFGGPPPFTGFATADRPAGATGLCAVVANPDHTVVPDSGNCLDLPNLPTIDLTGITVDAESRYVVDFQTQGFTPQYPGGTHIHFFFNTFSPEDVGIGGEANRKSYGGAAPFVAWTTSERPENATGLCAVVANPDHTVLPNSGNCQPLPDLPTAEIMGITVDAEGLYVVDHVTRGFTPSYPGGTHLHFYFDTFDEADVGIGGEANRKSHGGGSPFTGFATGDRPAEATRLCVVVAIPTHEVLPNSGNCYHLPDVLAVEITGINVDEQNRYSVAYVAYGFVPQDPGTHVHFFFDTVSPEQLGQGGGGHQYSHGGSSPYTGYSTADRPEGAKQLCAIVVRPDGSLVQNSGNCVALPDVGQEG
ncbi:MAG TPA: hypothetical protein VLC52_05030, partial [Anaerolineae bacterium]|nr:hypothetical protein [Anaerolineae bacterium]